MSDVVPLESVRENFILNFPGRFPSTRGILQLIDKVRSTGSLQRTRNMLETQCGYLREIRQNRV
jgi:hypothetical protein